MFNKKGSELSMNVIVLAAIAVLILIILVVLVVRGTGNAVEATTCAAKGGACGDFKCTGMEGTRVPQTSSDCKDDPAGSFCCVPISS